MEKKTKNNTTEQETQIKLLKIVDNKLSIHQYDHTTEQFLFPVFRYTRSQCLVVFDNHINFSHHIYGLLRFHS